MKRIFKTTILIFCFCLSLFTVCSCRNSTKDNTSSTEVTSTNSNCSIEAQQGITTLLENWANAYATHNLLMYNDCVSENLEYPDTSVNEVYLTQNYFDTVTACEIKNIDFESCKETETKTYTIPVEYTITYNNDFKEENGLTKGQNSISATMVIKENSAGEFYITEIN